MRLRMLTPLACLRFSVRLRLLRCRFWKSKWCRPNPACWAGFSTFTTWAPMSARCRTHVGPARARVRSITLIWDRGGRFIRATPWLRLHGGAYGRRRPNSRIVRPALQKCQAQRPVLPKPPAPRRAGSISSGLTRRRATRGTGRIRSCAKRSPASTYRVCRRRFSTSSCTEPR